MKRHLFNIFSALSLLLCAVAALLWMRSYDVTDSYSHRVAQIETGMISTRGEVGFYTRSYAWPQPNLPWEHRVGKPHSLPGSDASLFVRHFDLNYATISTPTGVSESYTGHVLDHSLIVAITALLPLAWAFSGRKHRVKHHRLANGQCIQCGYDLRGSTPGRCPECGATGQKKPDRAVA